MAKESYNGPLEQVDANCWRIPRSYKPEMRVDGLIFANERLLDAIKKDQAPDQVANVATLPGIQMASLAMPDIHWGYGFCIGGVCATDPLEGGVISPGGVGYDINCGVRLVKTNLFFHEIQGSLEELIKTLFENVPAGVGRSGKYKFSPKEMRPLLAEGPSFVMERGMGVLRDLDHTEANGRIDDADPDEVSPRAIERGAEQCGTLGSGNHFMEVQVVDQIFDETVATAFGLEPGQICVMIHSGSRGLGYQVCDDALVQFRKVPEKYGIVLPDKQLACAPADSPEGRKYIGAMRAAANYGFCNRQLLMTQAREVFSHVFGRSWEDLGMEMLYDVAHNIAKLETHTVDGVTKKVWVHRKGATRAFPAGHPEVPEAYRAVGQPVIIPGDMGRASWVLVGSEESMRKSFGTTCHGAGRAMSRTAAMKLNSGDAVQRQLRSQGVIAMGQSRRGLAEEQPKAYKNVDHVVEVVHDAGLSRKVARMRPIGVIKG
ncbi:RtcB family protein [Tuwongella immobilis]|uniref:tRNA-splicing ligase RtcB n=1 Tax=Tuwongella immobilis TaxID=692036 RepID=A0A6C2YUQ2_9BACT